MSTLMMSALVCMILIPTSPAQSRQRISCFLIGSVQPAICPLPGFFAEDPLFVYESDPHQAGLTLDERMKLDRLYFPRTRQRLLEKSDMVFFADPYIDHFTSRQFGDLYYAFTRGGMPSYWSFGPSYGHIIQNCILNDLIPISDYRGYFHKTWRPVFQREREGVFLPFIPLGMQQIPGSAYAEMKPREGTIIWADMQPLNLPWIVSWRPGGKEAGVAWVYADEFNLDWWGLKPGNRQQNPYALDMITNMILHSLGRSLIADIHARREARHHLSAFRSEKLLVISMLEWADMFGANTLALSNELSELDSKGTAAADQYIEQEYAACISILEDVSRDVKRISNEAVRLKDEALFWVYLSEWLAVSSAAIIGAVLLWSLMIRRKVYRAVKTTKLVLEQ